MSGVADAPPAVAGMTDVAGMGADDTMLIKKSCALRARYRLNEVHISPLAVVPHPLNRCVDGCMVLRCRGITSDIARWGFDVVEANQNAVLIEVPPEEAIERVRTLCCDPDYDGILRKMYLTQMTCASDGEIQ